jgi:hypothetical protein
VAGAERTHGHERTMLEYDVPSNGMCRRSYGGGFLREMQNTVTLALTTPRRFLMTQEWPCQGRELARA